MAEKPTYEELERRVQELEKHDSEDKSSKEALRNSEAQYRLLFEHANVGIFIAQDGYLKVPNPYLSKILGYSPAELCEQPFSLFIHPEHLSLVNTRHQERLSGKTGLPQTYDFRVISKNGTIIWVQLNTILIQLKGRPATLNFLHDITDRKRMEEELKESKLFLDKMSDIAYATDDQGSLLWVNRAAEPVTGMPREQIINKPFLALFMEKDRSSLMDVYQRTLKGEALKHVSTLKTGITCHFTSLPKYDKQGDIIGTFGVARDITERLKNEKDRLEMQKKIQQAEKAESLSRMAGAVAHHFNNMMFATIGNLEMARDELPAGTDIAENIASAEESAHKAAQMSRFMLTYLGQERRDFSPIDLSTVCSQYLDSLQEELPKEIELSTHIPFPGLIVKADQEQIQQILKAAIVNSVEAMEDQDNCSIKVSIEKTEADKICGENWFPKNWNPLTDEYVLLKIKDTGKGIDEKAKELIFDPFYTDKFTGRGLGLAMVLGIVKAHDGCITVESEVGKGTIFRVFLPLSTETLRR